MSVNVSKNVSEEPHTCYNGTGVPSGVVDSREDGTMLWMDELSDEKRRRTMRNSNTEADEESSCNKHGQVDGDTLENDTKDHDDAANQDTGSATKKISGIWNSWNGADGADGHDGVEDAQRGSLWVMELILPGL